MNWFAKRAHVIEAIEPAQTDEDRLAEVLREFRAAQCEVVDCTQAIARYNAIRQQLESDVNHALARRNALLKQRSELMTRMGMIR